MSLASSWYLVSGNSGREHSTATRIMSHFFILFYHIDYSTCTLHYSTLHSIQVLRTLYYIRLPKPETRDGAARRLQNPMRATKFFAVEVARDREFPKSVRASFLFGLPTRPGPQGPRDRTLRSSYRSFFFKFSFFSMGFFLSVWMLRPGTSGCFSNTTQVS